MYFETFKNYLLTDGGTKISADATNSRNRTFLIFGVKGLDLVLRQRLARFRNDFNQVQDKDSSSANDVLSVVVVCADGQVVLQSRGVALILEAHRFEAGHVFPVFEIHTSIWNGFPCYGRDQLDRKLFNVRIRKTIVALFQT